MRITLNVNVITHDLFINLNNIAELDISFQAAFSPINGEISNYD